MFRFPQHPPISPICRTPLFPYLTVYSFFFCTQFETRTKKEISAIEWHKIKDIINSKQENRKAFWMIAPYVQWLKTWLGDKEKGSKEKKKAAAAKAKAFAEAAKAARKELTEKEAAGAKKGAKKGDAEGGTKKGDAEGGTKGNAKGAARAKEGKGGAKKAVPLGVPLGVERKVAVMQREKPPKGSVKGLDRLLSFRFDQAKVLAAIDG